MLKRRIVFLIFIQAAQQSLTEFSTHAMVLVGLVCLRRFSAGLNRYAFFTSGLKQPIDSLYLGAGRFVRIVRMSFSLKTASARRGGEPAISPSPDARLVVFALVDRLSMIAFASAVEPLRLANRAAEREIFRWRLMSENGAAVQCSNGLTLSNSGPLEDLPRGALAFVASGVDAAGGASRPLLTWLRRQSRLGVELGALCTGAHILAKAGLLDGRRCTIHWENAAAFREEFPDVEVTNRLFEIDENRLTCAGGTAAADMMLSLIARDCGPELASQVADQIIHAPIRSHKEEQRLSVPARIGVRHPKLAGIIRVMEENLEEPISPSILARQAGMSTRQLERLFRRYLNKSPKKYYMEMRLEKARRLLLQTDMSVINVALACGFTSPSHFSKCYRSHYERTPYRERGAPDRDPIASHNRPQGPGASDTSFADDLQAEHIHRLN